MYRPLFLSFLFWLPLPPVLGAQTGTVQGRVADSSGVAVGQASILLEPNGPRAYSNDRGEYVLRSVPAGRYTMRVRRIGYDAEPIAITVIEGLTLQQPVVMRRLAVTIAGVNVVVGSRARHTAADELAVPVDVFTAAEIRQTGTSETAQVLQQLSPSVNFPRQSVSDATEIVRPFTMRGLSPDHSLVLLNGKRRHRTALVHYYGAGQGAGSSGVDMNAIPAGAIERLEVLRDGAAAQYGSDAIAGVVNVVLKEGAFAPFLTADLGHYMTAQENFAALPGSGGSRPRYPNDGRTIDVNGGLGFSLGPASLGLFAEYRDREPTNRAGPDPTDMFTAGDADVVVDGKLVQKNNPIPQPNHHWGDGASKDLMTFASVRLPFNETGSSGLYAFGGYSKREGTGFGYFRPPSSERNWTQIHPNGFLPQFAPDVVDVSAVGGIRGQAGRTFYDFGLTVGYNGFTYNLKNTLNASLGPCLETPCAPGEDGTLGTEDDPDIPNQTSFDAGELRLTEVVTSFDASRPFDIGREAPANLAYGFAFRIERYQIRAGEPASYINGFHPASDGSIAPSGSQVFPGFRPQDAIRIARSNIGAYVDVEGDLTPKLLANVAARFERYSDFGENLSGKLAVRYQPSPRLTLRSAVSTGFRAPSLNQSHYSSVVTNFKADPVTGNPVAFELGIFPVDSREARVLGARDLTAETSQNFSLGLAATPAASFTLTADFYYIAVNDRIVLTGFLDTPEVVAILQSINSRAEAAQYFTNAIDTRTTGLDLTGNYRVDALGGGLDLGAALNITRTRIPNENNIPVPPELANANEELIGRFDEGGLLAMTKERPDWRGTFTASYTRGVLSGLVRYSYYGKYTSSLYSYSGSDVQTYSGKGLTDVELGVTFRGQRLALGARNVFDVYPDRMSANNGFDIFPFPPASPFGYNGRWVYGRVELVRQ
jgi:iron complex outermembrane receptor protein